MFLFERPRSDDVCAIGGEFGVGPFRRLVFAERACVDPGGSRNKGDTPTPPPNDKMPPEVASNHLVEDPLHLIE